MHMTLNRKALPAGILLAIATGMSEFMVRHSHSSAYWGNATTLFAIATLLVGSVSWCMYDANRNKHQLAKRRDFVRKVCLGILFLWLIGFILESKLEGSAALYRSQAMLTFDNWYLKISTGICICSPVIIFSYGLVARRMMQNN